MEIEEINEVPELLESEFVSEQLDLPVAPNPEPPKPQRRVSTIALVGVFLLGVIGFLYFAKVFFLPVALALILSFLFSPIIKWLGRIKVPRVLGAALVLVVVLVALGNGITLLTKPATDFIASLPESVRRAEDKMRHVIWHAEQLSKAAAQVQGMTDGNAEGQPGPES